MCVANELVAAVVPLCKLSTCTLFKLKKLLKFLIENASRSSGRMFVCICFMSTRSHRIEVTSLCRVHNTGSK